MGGFASILAATLADKVASNNVGCSFAMQPAVYEAFPNTPVIPTFYGTGDNDTTLAALPAYALARYNENTFSTKAFASIAGGTHGTPALGHWNPYQVSFMNCHLKNQPADCRNIYTTDTSAGNCPLCNCATRRMNMCMT